MALHLVARRRAVLAGVVASLAVLLGGGAVVHFRAEGSWSEMQQRVDALEAEWNARAHRREPLWGDGTRERAFVHYERASSAALALCNERGDELHALLPARGDELPAADLRAAWRPLLTDLRAGAQATDVTPSSTPYAAHEKVLMNLLQLRWVANCALFEARALRRGGHDAEAVRVSLDAATLGADLLRHGVLINQMIGAALLAIATDAWHDERVLATLDHDALTLLAGGLERLDRSLPETLDLSAELLTAAYSLQHLGDWSLIERTAAWRFGFSTRWMIADEWIHYANGVDDSEQSAALAWPHRKAVLEAEAAEAGTGAMVLPAAHLLLNAEGSARVAIAHMRMLRMAVDLHRGLDLPPLRDPLGDGPLLVKREGNGVRLRSAGSTEQRPLERTVAR